MHEKTKQNQTKPGTYTWVKESNEQNLSLCKYRQELKKNVNTDKNLKKKIRQQINYFKIHSKTKENQSTRGKYEDKVSTVEYQ